MNKLEQVYKEFDEIQWKLIGVIEELELPEDWQEDDTFEKRYVELKTTLVRIVRIARWNGEKSTSNDGSLMHDLKQQIELIRSN